MQRLFATARWDPNLVRDDIRGYVAAALGDPGGVLIGDDTEECFRPARTSLASTTNAPASTTPGTGTSP